MTTTNLGILKALHVGTLPPENKNMIWRDISISPALHKHFNTVSNEWEPLKSEAQNDIYRQGVQNINGATQVNFSTALPSTNYVVEVLSYITSDGVKVNSGWVIDEQLKSVGNFVFSPPQKTLVGVLVYRAILFK